MVQGGVVRRRGKGGGRLGVRVANQSDGDIKTAELRVLSFSSSVSSLFSLSFLPSFLPSFFPSFHLSPIPSFFPFPFFFPAFRSFYFHARSICSFWFFNKER